VDNIETIVEKVKQAGGKQMTEIEEIPTIGLFCYCEDSESNHIGLIQISNYDTEGC
jgi:predicted enzyme related to lactoylglutathione lyase